MHVKPQLFDFQGLLYGAAIGDALGLSTAQMSPDECHFHYDEGALHYQDIIVDKYRLQWEKGDWTTAFDQMVKRLTLACFGVGDGTKTVGKSLVSAS